MPKGGGKSSKSGGNKRSASTWTAADHEERNFVNSKKKADQWKFQRSQRLTHNTLEKKEYQKLQLHITKTKRSLDALRQRLSAWDDVTERKRAKEEEEARRKKEQEEEQPQKRRCRPGPETWKLRGAARPAWEVYDFDTRYIDPHLKAHEEAEERAQRSRNLLIVAKGKFGSTTDVPQPVCRDFLGQLMHLGLLYEQANKIKSARTTFLECLELDSATEPITCARSHLMRIYLKAKRPESARPLWERFPTDDNVWIRYTQVLVEYQITQTGKTATDDDDETSSLNHNDDNAKEALVQAIRSNIYCAYYLAFGRDVFDDVMEYVEEIEDATEDEPLELAIEYCNSEQRKAWEETSGAIEWIRSILLRENKEESVSLEDLDWKGPLQRMEGAARAAQKEEEEEDDEEGERVNTCEDDLEEVDVLMFAGMFRTAMEMVEEQYFK